MPLHYSKIILLLLSAFSLFCSLPALAKTYPFRYEEVIIENPTCPFYYFEIGGEQVRQPCPYGTMKPGDKEGYIQIERAAAGLCRYDICSKEGVCREKTKFMGTDSVTKEYTGPGEDADKRCILAYSEDSKINTYCNLITGKSTKEFCFSFAPPNLNIYWIFYYAKIGVPILLGFIFYFYFRRTPKKAITCLMAAGILSLIGLLSNDGWKMELDGNFVYYMMIPPVLSIASLLFKKEKWFPYLFIINTLAIIVLVFMLIIPET